MLIKTKRGKVGRRRRKQSKDEHETNYFLLLETMEERRRVHRCHSQHMPLSYLHESSSNLSLHTHYIKRKEKPKLRNGKLG